MLSTSLSFLLAGFETTSTALGYSVWLLAGHPDIQQRLFQEIRDVFGEEEVPTV